MSAIERGTGASGSSIGQRQTVLEGWWGPDSSPRKRALAGALAMVAVVAIMETLNLLAGVNDWPMISVYVVAAIGIGLFVGRWLAIPAAYLGWVAALIVSNLGQYAIMGASWWEGRNAEHWQGSEAAFTKLLGQIMELAFVGLFIALLAGLGVLIRWLITRSASHRG
jgi:hypothetical protein